MSADTSNESISAVSSASASLQTVTPEEYMNLCSQQQTFKNALIDSGFFFWEYDIAKKTAYIDDHSKSLFHSQSILTPFPACWLDCGSVYPDDIHIFRNAFRQIDEGSGLEEFDIRILMTPDKHPTWFHIFCTVLNDVNGNPAKAICTAKNITSSKELRQTFAKIMNLQDLFIWKLDLVHHTAYSYYTPNNITGSESIRIPNVPESILTSQLLFPGDSECIREFYRRIYQGELDISCEFRVYNEQLAEYRWTRTTYTGLSPDTSDASVILGCCMDIQEEYLRNQQYQHAVFQHREKINDNVILWAYCNLHKNHIDELYDSTGAHLQDCFGLNRDDFYTGFGSFITEPAKRAHFLDTFLSAPLVRGFAQGDASHEMTCYVRFAENAAGYYIQIHLDLIRISDELCGLMTVTDISSQVFAEKLMYRTVENNYDFSFAIDLNSRLCVHLLTGRNLKLPPIVGQTYEAIMTLFTEQKILKQERAHMLDVTALSVVEDELQQKDLYVLSFTVTGKSGELYNKELQYSFIDRGTAQLSVVCIDLTKSFHDQQNLLYLLTNSVEKAGIVDIQTHAYTMHTTHTVTNDLPPLCGNNFDDYTNKSLHKAQSAADYQKFRQQFQIPEIARQLSQHPDGYNITYPLTLDGDERIKMMKFFWIDKFHHSFGLLRTDITAVEHEQQQQQESLRTALALAQDANQAKRNFLSSMSHDIRTPMNAIIGLTELALSNTMDQESLLKSLGTIRSSSYHLLALINNILDMGRIESGKMTLAEERFSHTTEFQKCIDRSLVLAQKKELHLTYSQNIIHDSCIGDSLRLQRTAENLIGNAIKFTPSGGNVSVSLNEQSYVKPHFGLFTLTVSDTGIGMDEQTKQHLFEPFYRQNDADTAAIEGSGLGLSIVKNFIDFCGGTIKVDSEPGHGSTFTITYPLRYTDEDAADIPNQTAEPVDTAPLKGLSVLVAEDHPVNQEVTRQILEAVGMQVTICENGDAAYKTFAKSKPQTFAVVLMDIRMPVMDGYESARLIRSSAHPQAADIPIIAMTANAYVRDFQKSLEAGMNRHLAKPVQPQALYRAILEVLAL